MTEFVSSRGRALTQEYEKLIKMDLDDGRYMRLHDQVFFPYDDDSYLQRRLSGKSRVIRKNEALQDIITEALAGSDDSSLLTANELIGEHDDWLNDAPNHVSKIIDHLNFCKDMDSIKVAAVGVQASVDRVTYLMYSRVNRLLASVPPETFDDFLLSAIYLGQRIEQNLDSTHLEEFDFFNSKMTELLQNAINIHSGHKYIRHFLADDIHDHGRNEVQADNNRVQETFKKIMESRTHGMSLGYIEADAGGSYIFSDLDTIRREWSRSVFADSKDFSQLAFDAPTIAQVTHSALPRPRYIRPTVKRRGEGSLQIAISAAGIKPISIMNIGPDGELYGDMYCHVPMSRAAAYFGKYEAYRKLQAEILGHYYNLTHSTTIDIDEIHSVGMSTDTIVRQGEPIETLSRLIIPRQSMVSHETEESNHSSGPRVIKFHDVVWHRRKLPPGWRPSPAAEKLAEEAGIKLEEGETFVRDYRRGSKELGEVVGHKLVERG